MDSLAEIWTSQSARARGHARSLIRVSTWELRRCQASRLFWLQICVLFAGVLLITWLLRASAYYGRYRIDETSSAGLFVLLPIHLTWLVLLLPLLTAESVTRDYQRRTRELLMLSTLPAWISVWGRYLASLLISLGLALLVLLATLTMEALLHLSVATYPPPRVGVLLLLWAGIVVPPVIFVRSCGFSLSTILPRCSLVIEVGISGLWVLGALVLPRVVDDMTLLPTWYVSWDPTSGTLAYGPLSPLLFYPGSLHLTTGSMQRLLLAFENRIPDLASWFVPHMMLIGLSLSLVLITALVFQSTRHTYSVRVRRRAPWIANHARSLSAR